jgi:hypothetical protein
MVLDNRHADKKALAPDFFNANVQSYLQHFRNVQSAKQKELTEKAINDRHTNLYNYYRKQLIVNSNNSMDEELLDKTANELAEINFTQKHVSMFDPILHRQFNPALFNIRFCASPLTIPSIAEKSGVLIKNQINDFEGPFWYVILKEFDSCVVIRKIEKLHSNFSDKFQNEAVDYKTYTDYYDDEMFSNTKPHITSTDSERDSDSTKSSTSSTNNNALHLHRGRDNISDIEPYSGSEFMSDDNIDIIDDNYSSHEDF